MRLRNKLALCMLLSLFTVFAPTKALLFPLLFPLSIKITIHSSHKPTPPPEPSYHFETVPVYKEVVVKGSAHFSTPKHSYGDGHKYGTSYGDGHVKVYTNEPHVKSHAYASGYGTNSGSRYPSSSYGKGHYKGSSYNDDLTTNYKGNTAYAPTHYKGTSYETLPSSGGHYKGTDYGNVPTSGGHYKGTDYGNAPTSGDHYKGTDYGNVPTSGDHYKGTDYGNVPTSGDHYKGTDYGNVPNSGGHYKAVQYDDAPTSGHYKGTEYDDAPNSGGHYKGTDYSNDPNAGSHYKGKDYRGTPETHYKGSDYAGSPGNHYKGNEYGAVAPHNKGTEYGTRNKVYTPYNYIKSVDAYKMSDYIDPKNLYQDDEAPGAVSHVAIPPKVAPGHTYAEIAAAHKATVNAGGPKAYASEDYSDLRNGGNKKEYEHDASYLDDSLPVYKANIPRPRPRPRPQYRSGYIQGSATFAAEPSSYAGFGTAVYGDSYAKVAYTPRTLRISIKAHAHR